ncbi:MULTISPECIES: hypothetical protein [Microbacterium]|jgi:hypothetical protein|uniref:hypothetical protein n=1 Tax=Microbacterium TaxID=33882 RepID=UPI001C2BAAB5|nr:hypothetical protein [Microbacterium paraoxydans]QXE31676.1 hypothetical protein IZR02_16960 [Microbacterium paraoxydans]
MSQGPEIENDTAWVDVPDELAAELDTYADLCHHLVLAWMEMARGLAVLPANGSPAATEARQFREAKPDAPANVEHGAGQRAGLYVDAISQQLLAVEALLRARRVAVALWPLVRAELEFAGRAAWLLDPRVQVEAGEVRVARLYLEAISSLRRERYTAGKFDRGHGNRAKVLRDTKIAEARAIFGETAVEIDLSSPDLIETWTVAGQGMASLGGAAASFADLCFEGKTKVLYDSLSDYSHPSLLTVDKQSIPIEIDGVARRPWTVGRGVVAWQVRLACLIFYKACHLVAGYYAIDDSALEQWADGVPPEWFGPDTVNRDES